MKTVKNIKFKFAKIFMITIMFVGIYAGKWTMT